MLAYGWSPTILWLSAVEFPLHLSAESPPSVHLVIAVPSGPGTLAEAQPSPLQFHTALQPGGCLLVTQTTFCSSVSPENPFVWFMLLLQDASLSHPINNLPVELPYLS